MLSVKFEAESNHFIICSFIQHNLLNYLNLL